MHTLEADYLGMPCRCFTFRGCVVAADPRDGDREKLIILSSPLGPESLIILDYDRNAGEQFRLGDGDAKVAHLVPLPNGDFYIPIYTDMGRKDIREVSYARFSLRERRVVERHSFGDAYPKKMMAGQPVWGPDGCLYAGFYKSDLIARVNPETWQADCLRPFEGVTNSMPVKATPGGKLLLNVGSEVIAYDVATEERSVVCANRSVLALVGNLLLLRTAEGLCLYDATTLEPIDGVSVPGPPSPDIEWTGVAESSLEECIFLVGTDPSREVEGRGARPPSAFCLWNPSSGETERTVWLSNVPPGGHVAAEDSQGRLLGFRGMDYFVLEPDGSGGDPVRVPLEAPGGSDIISLVAHPNGKVYVTPDAAGAGFAICDGQTGKTIEMTDPVCHHGPDDVVMALRGDQIVITCYPESCFLVYDPSEPWDRAGNRNPRRVGGGPGDRPIAGLINGPGGAMFAGYTREYYAEPGGTLIRFDPETEEIRTYVDLVSGQAIASLAADERYVYCGTLYQAHSYGTPVPGYAGTAPDGGAVFFIWDPAAEEIVNRFVFPGVPEVAALAHDPETRMVFVPVRNEIRRFSVETMSWLGSIRLPVDPEGPGVTCRRFAFLRLAGQWLVTHENRVFAIAPGEEPEPVLELPGRILATAVADDTTVYLAVAQHLYKAKIVQEGS